MKRISFVLVLWAGVQIGFSQSFIDEPGCPPVAWCGQMESSFMDALTWAASLVGDDMNETAAGADCEDSWNPSCVFARVLPCLYPADTPQGSMCDEDDDTPGAEKPDGENPPKENPPAEDTPPADDEVITEVLRLPNKGFTAERIYKYYDKTKKGTVLHKYPNGLTLRLTGKFRDKKKKNLNYLLVFNIVDKRNKTLASPVIYVTLAKNKKGHVMLKSDKGLLDYKWLEH